MGGPWFTVAESGEQWNVIDNLWISNGDEHERARLMIRVQLDEVRE